MFVFRHASAAVATVGCLVALVGCAVYELAQVFAEGADAQARWQRAQVTDYSFVLDSRRGERVMLGRFEVVVESGAVVDVRGLDEPAERWVADYGTSGMLTIAELFDEIDEARATGAEVVDIEFDESDGHPVSLFVDWDRDAVDDELYYEISHLRRR